MSAEQQSLIDDLATAVALANGATGDRRPSRVRVVYRRALAVKAERDRVEAWLRRAWDWCDANPVNARLAEREDRVIEAMGTYARLSDAMAAAEGVG